MNEKEYTYPHIQFIRNLVKNPEGPGKYVEMILFSNVITDEDENIPVKLHGGYIFDGKKDVEVEMDFAEKFHSMCKLVYNGTIELTDEDDEYDDGEMPPLTDEDERLT